MVTGRESFPMAEGTPDHNDKRFRSKSFSAGPSNSALPRSVPHFCAGFHHRKRDAYTADGRLDKVSKAI